MTWLKFFIVVAFSMPQAALAQSTPTIDLGALVTRAAPGEGQKVLEPLIGKWRVTKSMFWVVGTPERPVQSETMTAERKWIGDGRFLSDTTTGTIGGQPYFRTGMLGYNPMDKRYEWTTADNQTPIMMTYYGAVGSGVAGQIDMKGEFTDLGVTGERNVGKNIPMRTTIQVVNNDKHIYELYVAPPGEPEKLVDRMVFERIAAADASSGLDGANVMLAAPGLDWSPPHPFGRHSIANLWGDYNSGQAGILLKLPGGFKSGVHAHTASYRAVVISGTWLHKVSDSGAGASVELTPGSYWTQPANQMHEDECVSPEGCVFFRFTEAKFRTYTPADPTPK